MPKISWTRCRHNLTTSSNNSNRDETHQSHFHEPKEVRGIGRSDAAGGGAADLRRNDRKKKGARQADGVETRESTVSTHDRTNRFVVRRVPPSKVYHTAVRVGREKIWVTIP